MKWSELQEKAKVKLLVDLRVIDTQKVQAYAYLTPQDMLDIAPIAHKAGAVYTIYTDRMDGDVELFNESTDEVMMMDAEQLIPIHFQVL